MHLTSLTSSCVLLQRPFSVGVTLESLHAQSTDEGWNPTFLKTNEQIIHKVLAPLSSHCLLDWP
jgi:vacuolar protein sorting-associated protein 13A/C